MLSIQRRGLIEVGQHARYIPCGPVLKRFYRRNRMEWFFILKTMCFSHGVLILTNSEECVERAKRQFQQIYPDKVVIVHNIGMR